MLNRRHIVIITRELVPYHYGGIGTLFMSIANLFSGAGHSVSLLTTVPETFDEHEFQLHYGDVRLVPVAAGDAADFVDYSPSGGVISTFALHYAFSVAETFCRNFSEDPPDIVVSADFGAEAVILMMRHARQVFARTCFVLHLSGGLRDALEVYHSGQQEDGYNALNEPRNKLVCSLEDTCFHLADMIIAPSNIAWQSVRSRLRVSNDKVRIIPNLLAPDYVKRTPPIGAADDRYILFVGRLDRHKGADLLLEAYLCYCARYANPAPLIMVGRDCHCLAYGRTFLEEWRERIPPEHRGRITFTGQIDHTEVRTYFQGASVCLFPSRWEVFGIVCLEAMVYGVPVLVNEGTGLAGLLGDEFSDYIFNFEHDYDAVAEKLHELLNGSGDPRTRGKRFQKRGLEIVSQGESEYLHLLDNCIKKLGKEDGKAALQTLDNSLEWLEIVTNISRYLSKDYQAVTRGLGVSEELATSIVREKRHNAVSLVRMITRFFQ